MFKVKKEIDFKREVWWWKFEKVLRKANIIAVWLLVTSAMAVGLMDWPPRYSNNFVGISIISLIALLLFRAIIKGRRGQSLLQFWWDELEQPVASFPQDWRERTSLSQWAKDLLERAGRGATVAMKDRDSYQLVLEKYINERPFIQGSPEAIFIARERMDEEWAGMRSTANILAKKAASKYRYYLSLWDFFTKEQPEGSGIVTNLANPEEFRQRLG